MGWLLLIGFALLLAFLLRTQGAPGGGANPEPHCCTKVPETEERRRHGRAPERDRGD